MVSFKFSDIKKDGYVKKKIEAKILNLERIEYGKEKEKMMLKVRLGQGKSRCDAIAYPDKININELENLLQVGEGVIVPFPINTFRAKKRDKKFKKSLSTVSHDLIFQKIPKIKLPKKVSTKENESLAQVLQLQSKPSQFQSQKVSNLSLTVGGIYRYLGCKDCTKKADFEEGKYYCKGPICLRKQKKKNKVETLEKYCLLAYDVSFTDSGNRVLKNVVIYDKDLSSVIKGHEDFLFDTDVLAAVKKGLENAKVTVKFERRKKGPKEKFNPPVFATEIVIDSLEPNEPEIVDSDAENPLEEEDDDVEIAIPKFEIQIKTEPNPEALKAFAKWKHIYPIDPSNPGIVLLINNMNYLSHQKPRKGSEIDAAIISELFVKLDYEIFGGKCIQDVESNQDLQEIFAKYKTRLVEKNPSSAIIVIMGHGIFGEIGLTGGTRGINGDGDNRASVLHDILVPFSNNQFPQFVGKPKAFVFQACQHHGANTRADPNCPLVTGFSDMLLCYPTLPGLKAKRSVKTGSFFIEFFTKAVMDFACSTHLEKLMKLAQEMMRKNDEENGRKILRVAFALPIAFGQLYLRPVQLMEAYDSDE